MKKLTNKKGFTLVELLVVVAIIAILMLIAIPRFLDSTKGAKIKTFEGNFRTVVSSIAQYQATNAGSVKDINTKGSVKELVDSLVDKPKGAVYNLDGTKFEAKLAAEELGTGAKEYKITYTFGDGKITQVDAPEGAANLQNFKTKP